MRSTGMCGTEARPHVQSLEPHSLIGCRPFGGVYPDGFQCEDLTVLYTFLEAWQLFLLVL